MTTEMWIGAALILAAIVLAAIGCYKGRDSGTFEFMALMLGGFVVCGSLAYGGVTVIQDGWEKKALAERVQRVADYAGVQTDAVRPHNGSKNRFEVAQGTDVFVICTVHDSKVTCPHSVTSR